LNVAALDRFCFVYPRSASCENTIAAGPELAHENPDAATKFPMIQLRASASSTSAVSNGAPFIPDGFI
jgi:hypothetical protein